MDLIREIKTSLGDCAEKLRCIKVTNPNRNNDDYHLYVDEISDSAIGNFTEKVNFVEEFSKECQGKYRLKLKRPLISKAVISRVYKESTKYGQINKGEKNRRVFVNIPNIDELENGSLDDLRSLYMASLLTKLLLANSYEVTLVPENNVNALEVYIEEIFGGTLKREPVTNYGNSPTNSLENGDRVPLSDWFGEVKNRLQNAEDLCEILEEVDEATKEKCEKLKINLKEFIEDENLIGKFSANVNVLMLSPGDGSLKQLSDLENAVKKCKDVLPASCIHVVHNRNYLHQQKMEVLWRMMDGRVHQSIKQHHLIYSRVSADDGESRESNPAKLLRTRKLQIASAFRSKYGEKKAAFFTDEMMEGMAKASLRFELTSIKPTLETKILANSSCFEDRSGVFIFYNYARISTMLDKFGRLVEEGHYPPLPSVEEIDFCCLRQEEEWRLLFNHVLEYPTVVGDSVTRDDGGSVTNVATQKICQFLSSLSNSFSKYYSKTHILTDPLPHLLMTMQARLHLVRSIMQVYDNALALLCIKPLHRL